MSSGSLWRTLTLLLLGSQVFRCGGKEECSGSQGGCQFAMLAAMKGLMLSCCRGESAADLYVSFVMVGRADDLRGDYVSRLANSIQLIQKYSLLHHVESEIVVVEWNPFQGQPALSAVLRQFTSPAPPAPPIRIITVPNSFHRKVQGDTNQTFFEFMAKNVGARRARGEFVLVSNGDVVFNQHVFRALSKKLLDRDAYFRIPRVETSAVFDPREDVMRRIELVESMSTSLTEEPLCDVGQTFCPGRYNVGVCERGFLGSERHDIHFGNADELYMPAAGDFFLIHR
ncbi:hypothetical protein GUITHDRAFT_122241 [Guillardia theta CCMP2712]|uniref:Uncharacterized protein n=1 Tax=Guillardia theta (strain CCMP2712) TaxID=905079 RepID=L1I5M9_GUITC|nr:hypothetical protein GUITHDRAFT_122241 [Guillardia theta CCMP2712]EKX31568.1 hypothetical protein GUITHDRAFT_122241 [Guillardia theta CCMP2712]|eukprot:XP_005818548.1 hypothetical protein GUITHDRAFT_122241 [Guillardia theta CCMP2712]